ncbi:MAG: hypothetical protein KDA96_26695, partial [Planctomycetaceae bacterium]|nr:hypothetical protein [Planctomycetaceae bacterium]
GSTVDDAITDPQGDLKRLVDEIADDATLVDELFVRILNRPAQDNEIQAALDLVRSLPEEHRDLVAVLADYEQKLAPVTAQREAERTQKIAEAQARLTAYESQIADREAELDRQQAETIATAEAALKAYEAALPAHLTAWEAGENKTTAWTILDPSELSSTSATTLTRQDDLAITATSSNGIGTYKVIARTDLTEIRAVRLEALTDDSLPKKGPGRAPDGNFVLTDFDVTAAPAAEPEKTVKLTLENAQADFSQNNYDVATAIDGVMAQSGNGWAVSPRTGATHMASFEIKDPVGFEGGTILTFQLHQKFRSGEHSLGRFRLAVTNSSGPIQLDGLPSMITEILAVAADQRNDDQRKTLMNYYRGIDGELKKLQGALTKAQQPRPVDPKLKTLRDELAEISQPLPVDPQLAQLRADVELSRKQLENIRLTAAQDLTWALINSPAFLFNR